jgi:hypothetical protein
MRLYLKLTHFLFRLSEQLLLHVQQFADRLRAGEADSNRSQQQKTECQHPVKSSHKATSSVTFGAAITTQQSASV